jgi:hypothetical protein
MMGDPKGVGVLTTRSRYSRIKHRQTPTFYAPGVLVTQKATYQELLIDYMTKKEFIDFVNGLSCNDGMSVHMFLDPSDRDMRVGGTYHPKK